MPRVLILGYGNTLRRDDGLGFRAATALAMSRRPDAITALAIHQLQPELSELAAHADVVLFVDASRAGEPGQLRCRAVAPDGSGSDMTHHVSPAALLALAREIYGTVPRAFEISLCGESFEVGEGLSPGIESQLPRLIHFVADLASAAAAAP